MLAKMAKHLLWWREGIAPVTVKRRIRWSKEIMSIGQNLARSYLLQTATSATWFQKLSGPPFKVQPSLVCKRTKCRQVLGLAGSRQLAR
jgi:hypothetical protein